MTNRLYVGNLAYSVRDEDLQQQFAAFGDVRSAQVLMERDSALRYAAEQGLLWLQQHRPAALPLSLCSQE